MITSRSKQCLFSQRKGVVDKEKLHCCFVSWSDQDINKQSFFTFLERSVSLKTIPFCKKNIKTFKGKRCQVFCGVGTNTDEGVLGISEIAIDLQEAKGRERLVTTEKEGSLCNENEAAKLEIVGNCVASDGNEAVIIENGNFETVSDFSVVDKNSSILKDKNIDIIEESQSPCSFSLIRSIDNSVDNVPIPDLFDIGCSKSYNAEDNFSNDKFEKETGRSWCGDENGDVNSYHSDDNENVSVGNETRPIFVKVHPFFGRPVGEMCEDKRFNENEKVKLHLPYRVKDKESDLFNFHIFPNHYKNMKAMTSKNMPCNFHSLEDFFSKNLPEPHCHVSAECMLHWVNSGSGQKCVTFKAFLCGYF